MDREIALIWAEILGVDEVTPDSGFYDYGGTSLQAMRICVRVERLTGRPVAPELLFEAETFAEFVAGATGAPQAGPRR